MLMCFLSFKEVFTVECLGHNVEKTPTRQRYRTPSAIALDEVWHLSAQQRAELPVRILTTTIAVED